MARKPRQKAPKTTASDQTAFPAQTAQAPPETTGTPDTDPLAEYIAKNNGNGTSPERKATIYNCADYLKMSSGEIARRLSMDKRTVDAILQTRDSAALSARNLLTANVEQFAQDWVTASETGAKKGKHGAAKDALLHLKVIDPIQENRASVQVAIIVGAPGQPLQLSPPQVIDTTTDSDEAVR